jgi:antitoxin (DNA-binding transcriptional repressor) of toxin-antitoxin stability system
MATHRIGTGQLRSRTRDVVEDAADGSTIEIVRRGRSVARMESARLSTEQSSDCPGRGSTPIQLPELRVRAGRLLDRVAAGDVLEILDRGEAAARITVWHQPSE